MLKFLKKRSNLKLVIDRRKSFMDDEFFWEKQNELKEKIILIYSSEFEFGCGNWGVSWTISSEEIARNLAVYY